LALYGSIERKRGSIDIANRLIDRITEGFWLLGKHPYLGRPRSEDLRPGLRTFPIGEYLIVYQVRGEDAAILHVMRGSRDIEGLLTD
jgi:toxin ParE1/3/4